MHVNSWRNALKVKVAPTSQNADPDPAPGPGVKQSLEF